MIERAKKGKGWVLYIINSTQTRHIHNRIVHNAATSESSTRCALPHTYIHTAYQNGLLELFVLEIQNYGNI